MGNFSRDGKRSSGGGFSRGGFGGRRSSFSGGRGNDRPMMHKATCSECGEECQVPFRPTGEKPVFCSSCFEKQGNGGRPARFGSERHDRRDRTRSEDREKFSAVCDKCGEECQVPFRPTPGKPIFCDNCFEKTSDRSGKSSGNAEILEQIKLLNEKIDNLITTLTSTPVAKEKTKKTETAKETKTKKAKTTKKTVTKEKTVKKPNKKKVVTKKKK